MCNPSRYTQRKGKQADAPCGTSIPQDTDVHKKGMGIWGTGPRRVGKDILLGGEKLGRQVFICFMMLFMQHLRKFR